MYREKEKEGNIPQRILKALKLFTSSIAIQQNANTPLVNAQPAHVTMAPKACAATPLASLPKKLLAIARTSMYIAVLSSDPSFSLAYVGM